MPPKKKDLAPLTKSTVYVRLRPETYEGGHSMLNPGVAKSLRSWDETSVTIGQRSSDGLVEIAGGDGVRYKFPRKVLDPAITQDDMYKEMIEPFVDVLLTGGSMASDACNVLFFAYGQTGTGKTHTMLGPDVSLQAAPSNGSADPSWGCFPRVVYDVFNSLKATPGVRFVVSITALECYMMGGADLLHPGGSLPFQLDLKNRALGLTQVVLNTPADVINVLKTVRANRKTRSTAMNSGGSATMGGAAAASTSVKDTEHSGSSRSHALLNLHVTQLDSSSGNAVKSTFTLVDLAGAERPDKTNADRVSMSEAYNQIIMGQTPSVGAQGVFINYELSMLASEVQYITEANRQNRLYRPSGAVNTTLIRSIGSHFNGSAVTMVVTLSQAPSCGWETWFSCEYGTSLAKVKSRLFPQPRFNLKKRLTGTGKESIDVELVALKAEVAQTPSTSRFLKIRCQAVVELENEKAILSLLAESP